MSSYFNNLSFLILFEPFLILVDTPNQKIVFHGLMDNTLATRCEFHFDLLIIMKIMYYFRGMDSKFSNVSFRVIVYMNTFRQCYFDVTVQMMNYSKFKGRWESLL